MFSFLFFFLALVSSIWVRYRSPAVPFSALFLRFLLFFNVGLQGLLASVAHVFWPAETARQIGWAPGSPFQFEMGMANLAFGLLGVLSLFWSGRFRLATALGSSILFLGCAYGHWVQYLKADHAPYNSGAGIIFADFVVPLIILVLALCRRNDGVR